MQKDQLHHDVRKTRIYRHIYRPSYGLSHFLGSLLAIVLQGQSQVPKAYRRRS